MSPGRVLVDGGLGLTLGAAEALAEALIDGLADALADGLADAGSDGLADALAEALAEASAEALAPGLLSTANAGSASKAISRPANSIANHGLALRTRMLILSSPCISRLRWCIYERRTVMSA